MGFRLNFKWKWGPSVQSPLFSNSSSRPSCSFRGRETVYDSARSFPSSAIYEESENVYNVIVRSHTCSSSPQSIRNNFSDMDERKVNMGSRSDSALLGFIDDDNIQMSNGEEKLAFFTSLQASKASHFRLLMKNLHTLEETFADSVAVRLEKDILVQLQRLGALNLFHTFLSRTVQSPALIGFSDSQSDLDEEPQVNHFADDHMAKTVICSGKKEERKLRRWRTSEMDKNITDLELLSHTSHNDAQQLRFFSFARRSANSRSRKHNKISRNEAELSRGIKLVAKLERIKTRVEEETGEAASLSTWAEAAGVNKRVLREDLHFGWCCRDELIRSTRSLVLYIARNYRGLGLPFEDLIQAGNFGVLQGAERFDHNRGYKFSTYVQYWIRKSMSMLVAQHARGIRIPFTLSKAINQIQKAQKVLSNRCSKHPDDNELAKYTGLSLAKITSASRCLRVVGSINQKVGNSINAKYLELLPDSTIKTPEDSVLRQHMERAIYDLLNGLDPREKEVLVLRFGLENYHCKSLEEIGKIFNVSKEWIRKIERSALTKLRDQETNRGLHHFMYFF